MHLQSYVRSCWPLVGALLLASGEAQAQDVTPDTGSRPLRFVVPFTPGGGSDNVARSLSPKLSQVLGRPVVIDNRPGAGITLASDLVSKAPGDGNTILIVTIAHAVNPSLYKKLPYDTEKDFAPLTLVTTAALVLVVHPSLPVRSVSDLVALAKAKPQQLNYSTPGNGSPAHLSGEMFKSLAGVRIEHVPYKGAAGATTDLLAGNVQLTFSAVSVAPQLMKAGKLRGLAVTTATRARAVPELPTIAEAGLKGYEVVSWQGLLAPGKTPKETVEKLHQALAATLGSPEVKEIIGRQGYDIAVSTPQQFAAYISHEIKRWSKLVSSIGVRPD